MCNFPRRKAVTTLGDSDKELQRTLMTGVTPHFPHLKQRLHILIQFTALRIRAVLYDAVFHTVVVRVNGHSVLS